MSHELTALEFADLLEQARRGTLPEGFDNWDYADDEGCTVAHVAVSYRKLPDGFDRWHLATEHGWTVAHEAARNGYLPEGFDQYHLRNTNGWTVAHEAECNGHLPEDFDWMLAQEQEPGLEDDGPSM